MNLRELLALVVSAALLAGCGGADEKKELPKEGASEKAPESGGNVKHGTNGEVIVSVEAKMQQTMGLQTAALESAKLSPELKAYGRVLDPSPLASLTADLVTAEAAGQASQAEFNRLKTLVAQNNASERALQLAQASAVRDQAQIQSVRLRLLASWGGAISQRNDLADFVQSLGSLSSALVQLEIPAGDAPPEPPNSARLFTLGEDTKPMTARLVGLAPAADPQMQGRGFLFLVSPNPMRLVPGTAVTGFLSLAGEPRSGVLLPRNAVVRFNGTTWVYLQASAEGFERKQVTLDSPLENGWFVAEGLSPQDKVVTVGSQQLLSEELKGQGGSE